MAFPTVGAVAELQRTLTVPNPSFSGNNPTALAALEQLRNQGDPAFLFWRATIELTTSTTSNNREQDELLFHCITGCRHVLLHRWTAYAPLFRQMTRDYLFCLGINQTTMSRTIRLACYTAVASFWKRRWIEGGSGAPDDRSPSPQEQALIDHMNRTSAVQHGGSIPTKRDLYHTLETALTPSGQQPPSQAAVLFLSILVGEFMGKSTGVPYHLPMEFHKLSHSAFENEFIVGASGALSWSMRALSYVVGRQGQQESQVDRDLALPVVQLTVDILGWEFGASAWDVGKVACTSSSSSSQLLLPPAAWKDYLMQPDFVVAIFHFYRRTITGGGETDNVALAHASRQLLLQLASLSGPIFGNPQDDSTKEARKTYCKMLVDGLMGILPSSASGATNEESSSELLDLLAMMARLLANYKLYVLVQLERGTLERMLGTLTTLAVTLFQAHVQECESVLGDVESMEHGEFREEALKVVLDGAVLLSSDPWLHYSGTEESRQQAREALSNALFPLYNAFVSCRLRMANLEEKYLMTSGEDLDEVREEILAAELEEEMESVASIGRLHLSGAMSVLSSLFQRLWPQLQSLWEHSSHNQLTSESSAMLEEARLLVLCLGHLLTDDCRGETPVIPESITLICRGPNSPHEAVEGAVQSICQLAEFHASKIAQRPADPQLSPLLATTFLWFLNRWAPAYLLPVDYGPSTAGDGAPTKISSVWGLPEKVQATVDFCTKLCLHYHCGWPQEGLVQEKAAALLSELAKRGNDMRSAMVSTVPFQAIVQLHCITSGIRHNASKVELETAVKSAGGVQLSMVQGYQRLPYRNRSEILTALLVACSDEGNTAATSMFSQCLSSAQSAFVSLVQALETKTVRVDDLNAKEMALLCVELFVGVARSGDMESNSRVPQFLTPVLAHLSGLMKFYAEDLSICEALLRFYRDYTESFIATLDKEQSLALFQASADLLKSYSSQHCAAREVKPLSSVEAVAEEEQAYGDVSCAIQLLIHLGTKDFLDISTATKDGIDSQQVTDIIFFGLQQIIPLMTQGLLQFPNLCSQYFNLVGFMMDTYPDKVCVLQYDLFDALLESLLFGMSYVDSFVAKSSLQGISGLVREHLKHQSLSQHLVNHPDIFDKCSSRLLQEVVFQSVVWDRLEPSGMALLPLAAADLQRFVSVVSGLTQQIPTEHQERLSGAFQKLVQPTVLSKVSTGGYEGRMNRLKFKKDFEVFVREVHAFLVVR